MKKSIIVTGAASGIGNAVARRLFGAGDVRLLLVDRNEALLNAVIEDLGDRENIDIVAGNLAERNFCRQVVERCVAFAGRIDGLISNAGVTKGAPLAELSEDDFDYLFAVNTRPTWLLGKYAFTHLTASQGAIVATASISAHHPTPPLGSYAASKAALVMLVRQMALEWGPFGIRANCVSPGPTLTPLAAGYADPARRAERSATIPLRKLGTADDVAAAICFLIGSDAGHITGQDIVVDGGLGNAIMTLSGSATGQPQNG